MDDELEISARNLILCREVSFDGKDTVAPYTLKHVLSAVRSAASASPRESKPICAYVEYFGRPGEYEVWIDVVFLGYDVMREEVEESVVTYGPFDLNMPTNVFVEGRYYYLRNVPLFGPGIYEFQLKIAGVLDQLISQRLYVEEWS